MELLMKDGKQTRSHQPCKYIKYEYDHMTAPGVFWLYLPQSSNLGPFFASIKYLSSRVFFPAPFSTQIKEHVLRLGTPDFYIPIGIKTRRLRGKCWTPDFPCSQTPQVHHTIHRWCYDPSGWWDHNHQKAAQARNPAREAVILYLRGYEELLERRRIRPPHCFAPGIFQVLPSYPISFRSCSWTIRFTKRWLNHQLLPIYSSSSVLYLNAC